MSIPLSAYRLISSLVFGLAFPAFFLYSGLTGRHRAGLSQRLGLYPKALLGRISGTPRIWMHAVSVGEVQAALPIIASLEKLFPECALILSSTTAHGHALAKAKLPPQATCLFAPVDFIGSIRKALAALRPDILVCMETEIWPNWLSEAHRRGVKTAIVNGRISERSFKGYLKIRPLLREALKHVDGFSMIRAADARRIARLGAPGEKIVVNGNAKFDGLPQRCDPLLESQLKRLYRIRAHQRVFVAGSTRHPEEPIILDAYQKILSRFPDTLLIMAPRHVQRAGTIASLVRARGIDCQLRSRLDGLRRLRTAPVVILDTIGELGATYSVASITFCGGSLVPRGGQNILEAAAWGKPVMFGPHMENFLDAKALLDAVGGGIQVADGRELAETCLHYLGHPDQARQMGALALQAVSANQAAALKHVAVIRRVLQRGDVERPA